MKTRTTLTGIVALAASLTAASASAGQAQGAACDRACLTGIADTYVAAMVAHDPSKAPMAPTAKFTEQSKPLAVGEGLWKSAVAGPTTFKIPVPDPVSGQIGVILMMKATSAAFPAGPARGNAPSPQAASAEPADIQLALRLKVVNRRITEAEHIIARISAPSQLNALKTPRAALLQTVPRADRSARNIMLLIANSYYDALTQSNGSLSPFADDCGRRENGMHTAGVGRPADATSPAGFGPPQGCAEQLDSRAMSYIVAIDLRRVEIADPETGLAFGMTMFRHPMEQKSVTLLNKDGSTTERPMNFEPFDLEAAHIFKISGEKIHEIEAMGFSLPYRSKNGWSQFIR